MPTLKLTPQGIAGLRATGPRETIYRDTVVPGLLLEVYPSGKKTFVAWGRTKKSKEAWRFKLGVYQEGVYTLKMARDDAKVQLALGRNENPAEAKRRDKEAGTFGQAVESFLKDPGGKKPISAATLAGYQGQLNHKRLDGLRRKNLREIDRGDIMRVLDDIRRKSFADGGKAYSANRTFEAIRRVFSWAGQRGHVSASPCFGLSKPVEENPRETAYSEAEFGKILAVLAKPSTQRDAVRLALLTGRRINECLAAGWEEFDLDAGIWTIPADRQGNKSKTEWKVPLSTQAVKLVRDRRKGESPWVFPSTGEKGGPAKRSQKAMDHISEKSGVTFMPHDLRRTLRTWLSDHRVSERACKMILGQLMPKLERTYDRSDYWQERKDALERWADHCDRLRTGESAKILPMPAAAAAKS